MDKYDVIIIGSGVTGLGAAWYLTEYLKKKTLLLEQFPFPHQFGSSAGHSRIIRQLYDQYFNCNLMKEAVLMWRDLENKTEEKLFIQNGLLTFGPPEDIIIYRNAIEKSGISAYMINESEAKERFPVFNISSKHQIIFDPIAGVLRADKCLSALLKQCLKHGLEFHDMEKVIDVAIISNDEVHVTTNKNKYSSTSVILASGIWSKNILDKLECYLPLKPVKIHYGYFNSKSKDESTFEYNNFPSFFVTDSEIYGCAGAEIPGCLKIGDFSKEEIKPDERDSDGSHCVSKELFLKTVISFLEETVPLADTSPVNITTCVIMKTPDDQPIIDRHPKFSNVIIGCGFCGCGFKTGVIHGKMLANLATGQKNDYEMNYFSIKRFS